jgi:exopolysaccharide biosynthesis predicted pyruvyltransferase EpsI
MDNDVNISNVKQILVDWLGVDRNICFYPNPGNAGDCLIASATWQVFDEIDIQPHTVKPRNFKPEHIVILGGGGNFIPHYADTEKAIKRCIEIGVNKCILLPSTIRGNEATLKLLDSRFTIICRDLASLNHVRNNVSGAHVFLSRDMVFNLDRMKLKTRVDTLAHKFKLVLDQDWFNRGLKWRRGLRFQRQNLSSVLSILRSDLESNTPSNPDKLSDLNAHFITKRMGRASCDQVSNDIIQLLTDARGVVTDRLHIAIPALLVNCPLQLQDNNYGKLSAVLGLVRSEYAAVEFPD